jgi:serine/threonine-protein kinase RsbW
MILRLELTSAVDLLDLVQVAGDRVAREIGLSDDAVDAVGLAIRESVINAITHGNENDASKHVFVEFDASRTAGVASLVVRVRDEGRGFDPSTVADPLAPENLLKSGGRGIFLIRTFMDDVRIERAPGGGTEIHMTKRLSAS